MIHFHMWAESTTTNGTMLFVVWDGTVQLQILTECTVEMVSGRQGIYEFGALGLWERMVTQMKVPYALSHENHTNLLGLGIVMFSYVHSCGSHYHSHR